MSPRLLPLIDTPTRGSRSRMTCTYRCGNACYHPEPNRSGNPHIGELLSGVVGRRSVLAGTAAASAGLAVGALANPSAASAATGVARPPRDLTFAPVAPNNRDNVTVPVGYDYDVIVKWGDAVLPGAPEFDAYDQSPEAQAQQFGYNCDYVSVVPIPGRRGRAVLAVNHEYTTETIMFPTDEYSTNAQSRIAIQAHGLSMVEVRRGDRPGAWEQVPVERTTLNRRITADTPMQIMGPAAGTERMRTSYDPSGRVALGTFNNCSGGTTPWGTILTGEENFNFYFTISDGVEPAYAESYDRYSLDGEEARAWGKVDPRFDLSQEPHEPFRIGWIVEIDPFDPTSRPRKHTLLGRLKHEGANISVAPDGRVVAYMGDDERGEYMYKFVSAKRWRDSDAPADREHNMTLLDTGTLYVARFRVTGGRTASYDGTGRVDPAGQPPAIVRAGHGARRRAHRRAARGRHGARHPDGPARGRRRAPADRPGLRRADQQQRARYDVRGQRGEPAGPQPDPRVAGRSAAAGRGQPQRLRPRAHRGRGGRDRARRSAGR